MPKKYFSIVCLAISYWLLAVSPASAQLDLPGSLLLGQQQKPPTIKINSGDLVLVWSANTYVPPGYPGKALPTYDSMVKISTLPMTKAGENLQNVIYNWYIDGAQGPSAYGEKAKDFLFKASTAAGSYHSATLKITDSDNNQLLSLTTIIPVTAPVTVLSMESSPSAAAYSSAAETASLSPGQTAVFAATPYFFNVSTPFSLNYQWTFDNAEITRTEEKNKFSVKIADGDIMEAFTKNLGVLAVNPFNEIERAAGDIKITISKN